MRSEKKRKECVIFRVDKANENIMVAQKVKSEKAVILCNSLTVMKTGVGNISVRILSLTRAFWVSNSIMLIIRILASKS